MNSALFPEIRSHWPLFDSSERHKGDRSADFSQSNVRRARKLASAYPSQLLQTFSHSLGQTRSFLSFWLMRCTKAVSPTPRMFRSGP